MLLLINRESDYQIAADEVRRLTGNYYANNNFEKLQTDWILAQEEVVKIVGADVMTRALAFYHSADYVPYTSESISSGSGSDDTIDSDLVHYLQIPIAFLATHNYYQSNMVSHEDTGRKVKINEQNEKMPWEWMIDRDDLAQLRKIHGTLDRLLIWLETNAIDQWIDSPQRIASRKLFVNTTAIFQAAYPIDQSPRFFYTVLAFNLEAQTRIIKKAIGSELYDALLTYWTNFQTIDAGSSAMSSGLPGGESSDYYDELIALIQTVIPLFTMTIAVKRLSLSVLPYGVVQQFQSQFQSRQSSQVPQSKAIEAYCQPLLSEVQYALDDIKKIIQSSDPEAGEYQFLPTNDENNKYFRA